MRAVNLLNRRVGGEFLSLKIVKDSQICTK